MNTKFLVIQRLIQRVINRLLPSERAFERLRRVEPINNSLQFEYKRTCCKRYCQQVANRLKPDSQPIDRDVHNTISFSRWNIQNIAFNLINRLKIEKPKFMKKMNLSVSFLFDTLRIWKRDMAGTLPQTQYPTNNKE